MKKLKNKLDERQENALKTIESQGFWIAFWGLLAILILKIIVLPPQSFKSILPEWALFMVLALYVVVQCLRHNIWSRCAEPSAKTNALASAIAGLAIAAVVIVMGMVKGGSLGPVVLALAGGSGLATALLTFAALSVTTAYHKKKLAKLENEPLDDDE